MVSRTETKVEIRVKKGPFRVLRCCFFPGQRSELAPTLDHPIMWHVYDILFAIPLTIFTGR